MPYVSLLCPPIHPTDVLYDIDLSRTLAGDLCQEAELPSGQSRSERFPTRKTAARRHIVRPCDY